MSRRAIRQLRKNPAYKDAEKHKSEQRIAGGEMAAAAGILNHHTTAAQALAGKTAASTAAAASTTSSTSSDSATISANDFLTLLVTEMKNQDPTADTDPNEYINQLVNVNSLEQLISINGTLTTDLGSTTTDATVSSTTRTGASAQSQGRSASAQAVSSGAAMTVPGAISAAAAKLAPGNLGIPMANASAARVAQSLSGQF
jgi:flagellar basal-body rod modification protein FlgD